MQEKTRKDVIREVIRKARRITSMLQGTMSLEGQGLDPGVLRRMNRDTIKDLLNHKDSNHERSDPESRQ